MLSYQILKNVEDGNLELAEHQLSQINVFGINRMAIRTSVIEGLAKIFKNNKTIKFITLESIHLRKLSEDGLKSLFETFKNNRSLTSFSTINSTMEDEEVEILSEMFKVNSSINSLDLSSSYKMKNKGVRALTEMLKINQSITSLNLSSNRIDSEGVRALVEMLKINQSITSLNLSYNRIDNKGVRALTEMLKINQSITSLNLSYNQINSEGVKVLVEMLKINNSINILSLNCFDLSDEHVTILSEVIETSKSLSVLELLYNNKITINGTKQLNEAMKLSSSIISLGHEDRSFMQSMKKRILIDEDLDKTIRINRKNIEKLCDIIIDGITKENRMEYLPAMAYNLVANIEHNLMIKYIGERDEERNIEAKKENSEYVKLTEEDFKYIKELISERTFTKYAPRILRISKDFSGWDIKEQLRHSGFSIDSSLSLLFQESYIKEIIRKKDESDQRSDSMSR